MPGNTFGKAFTVTTFGESHGVALGCVVDGCPPGFALVAAETWSSSARVSNTGPEPADSSSATIAAHSVGVFPGE